MIFMTFFVPKNIYFCALFLATLISIGIDNCLFSDMQADSERQGLGGQASLPAYNVGGLEAPPSQSHHR